MKTKIFTLFLALVACVGTMFADFDRTSKILIGELYYYLDDENNKAEVTSQASGKYSGIIVIPSSVEYNATIYNVTNIGYCAFFGCSELTSITIPNSVTTFGNAVLSNCDALRSIESPALYFNEAVRKYAYVDEKQPSNIINLTINGGELTADGFDLIRASYRSLASVDLKDAENMVLPDVAFRGCYNIQTLILPDVLEQIGYMALAECKNLQTIVIPASVTEISSSAFEDCRSLRTITFGGSSSPVSGRFEAPAVVASQLQRIGNWAFYNCHELQNLEIPEGVTEIGDGAFYGCTYLEDLSLPSSIHAIGDNTFALCAKMKKIIVNAPVPPTIQSKIFFDVKRQIPIYVPDEVVDAYKDDTYWGEFDIQGVSHMPLGIDDINAATKSQKIVRDNQVLILRGDKTYTTDGRVVR